MRERMFLEEVGKVDSASPIGNVKAWEIRELLGEEHPLPLIYVVESEAGERFLLGRELSGRAKFNLIRYIAKSFVEIFFERLKGKGAVQYLILPDAYAFDLQYAMGVSPPYDRVLLPTEFILFEKGSGGKAFEKMTSPGPGTYRGRTWFIPNTALTCEETVVHFLRNAFSSHRPEEIYLFTACGSLKGIETLYNECLKASVRLVPVVSQCLFHVSKPLEPACSRQATFPILNLTTLTSRVFLGKATERYQGKEICSVGDVQKSLNHPVLYCVETLREMMHVGMDPAKENWDAWSVDVRSEEMREKIHELDPAIYDYFRVFWD